ALIDASETELTELATRRTEAQAEAARMTFDVKEGDELNVKAADHLAQALSTIDARRSWVEGVLIAARRDREAMVKAGTKAGIEARLAAIESHFSKALAAQRALDEMSPAVAEQLRILNAEGRAAWLLFWDPDTAGSAENSVVGGARNYKASLDRLQRMVEDL